jgi:type I restriction enzyme S subunit
MTMLPPGWALKSLSDVCLPVMKADPVSTGHEQVKYVDIGSVDGERHSLPEIPWVYSESAPNRCRQIIGEGDTLFSTVRPYLEKIAFVDSGLDGEFASTGFCVLRPGPKVLPRYLFHYSVSRPMLDQVLIHQRGVSYPAVLDKNVKAATIPLPPLEEQRRIVDILEDHLSRLDAAESASQAAQIRSKQWQRSIMLRAVLGGTREVPESLGSRVELAGPLAPDISLPVGWRWRKWRDVGSSQNGKLFPSSDYSLEGIRLLRPGNMGADGSLTWTPNATRRLPASYANSHAAMLLAPNDLVMNLTAQSLKDDFLGRVCIIGSEDSSLLNQRIARLTTFELTPDFALLVFRSPLFREHVKALNTGSLIQHMFTKQINEFWLPVPPKDVQVAVAADVGDKLAVALRMTDSVSAMKTRSAALRRSLLGAAFSGHLSGRSSDMEMVEEIAGV